MARRAGPEGLRRGSLTPQPVSPTRRSKSQRSDDPDRALEVETLAGEGLGLQLIREERLVLLDGPLREAGRELVRVGAGLQERPVGGPHVGLAGVVEGEGEPFVVDVEAQGVFAEAGEGALDARARPGQPDRAAAV